MKTCHLANAGKQTHGAIALAFWLVLGISLAVLTSAAQDKGKGDQEKKGSNKGVGFILSADATEKDLGLPIYPGARQHKDNAEDSPALNVGLWGGSSGFRLAVLKLESSDSPERVAAFYRKALASYGTVLDCGQSVPNKSGKSGGGQSNALDCEGDRPVKGSFTLEVGTKEKMHAVGIEPNGKGSLISLVYVESPKSNEKN